MAKNSMDFRLPPKTPIGSVVNGLALEAHETAVQHGFYEEYDEAQDYLSKNDQPEKHALGVQLMTLAQLAKIGSEVGEAVRAIQHGEHYQLHEELADIVIRTLDLAAFLDCRIGDCIVLKMKKNKDRPYKHGKVC